MAGHAAAAARAGSRIGGRVVYEDEDEDEKPQVRGKRPRVQVARSG
jgi:hypothetical protein